MPARLTDDDLLKLSHLLAQEADSFLEESIRPSRAKALRYYLGENPDNLPLVDGRSQMVDTQVRDTIEWIMPDLCRTFAGDDEVVAIEPHGDEDNFDADLAEQWCNYVIMRQNRGFLTTHHWIKDALLEKVGFLKQYWKTETFRKRMDFEGLSPDEFEFLEKAEDFDVVDSVKTMRALVILPDGSEALATEEELVPGMEPVLDPDGDPMMEIRYDVSGYQLIEEAKIIEDPLPPEEVLFSPDAKTIPWDCDFIAHGREMSIGALRDMFPDKDIPDDIEGWNLTGAGDLDEESIERLYDSSSTEFDDGGQTSFIDPTRRKVWVYEMYMKCDRDGDGHSEWVKIHRVGRTLLEAEEVEYPKIFAICPLLFPHRAVGLSLADLTVDLQELHTALNRQVLDNIYLTNNPRHEISMSGATEDTLDDYLDDRIGGYIRVESPGTVSPLQNPQLQPWTFNLMEMWEQKRESRTGVSRLNGGMDPDSLNKTATGVVQILNQAARRIEQIARIFAETGFRDRIQGILDLSMEYPEYVKDQVMRLTGEPVSIDPEKITGRYDLIVNAGIGSGNRDQHAAHMMQLMQVHQQLVMSGLGPGSEQQMVTLKNLYNVVRDMIANWGHRNTADYITDPSDKNAERDPVQQKGPSPEEMKAQAEQQKLQLEAEKAKMDHQVEMEKLAIEREKLKLEQRKIEAEEWKMGAEAASKAPNDTDIKRREMALKEEIERRRLRLEERELALKEREAEDESEEDIAELTAKMDALIEAASKPKRIKRNEDGLIEEIA